MPLASLFNLQFNGSASGAMITDVNPTSELNIGAYKRLNVVVTTSVSEYLKATRLRNRPITVNGIGESVTLAPRKNARIALAVNIGATPSAFDITQSVLNAIAASYNISGTIGAKINSSGSSGGGGGGGGTIIREDELAQGGNKRVITLNSAASASNNLYEGSTIVIMSGTGAGQSRRITRYNGTTKVADVSPTFTIAPDNTSVYRIIP